jgi:multicomponent K+:H+ antiporter subunit D
VNQLPILAILVPLAAGGVTVFFEHRRYGIAPQRLVAWTSLAAQLAVAGLLIAQAADGRILGYLLGDWPSRLGIVLMVDRLSAWMLLTTSLLAIACLLHASAGWDRRAPHFHAFFQFQLMGLNGAFLTGDLFNLFVFFEILLAASYGLMLSGGRGERIRAGFHYVVFNVAASSLFLIALGLLYPLLGSLNMAEIAVRIAQAPPGKLAMIQSATGLLLVAFCAKAALLPMYFWLPETYPNAPATVAALFAIMTKVGLYATLRVLMLLFGAHAGDLAGFAWPWLLAAGTITLILASLGAMEAVRLRVLAAYLILASAGTLFIAFGMARVGTVSAGLYYLAQSAFAGAALFMIADMVRRRAWNEEFASVPTAPTGRTVPGILFLIVAINLAGLPPLPGFIGKLLLLKAIPVGSLWLWLVILGSGFLTLLGLMRAGVRLFWRDRPDPDPPVTEPVPMRPVETAATLLLLVYCVALTVAAAPVQRYATATAIQLQSQDTYVDQIRAVQSQRRMP